MTLEANMTYEATASGAPQSQQSQRKAVSWDLGSRAMLQRATGSGGAPRADHYSERDQAQVVREEGRAPCCLRMGVV
jgi:hypothetical protein